MQKIVFKRTVPFRTESGTILTDTIIIQNDIMQPEDVLHVLALVEANNSIVRHSSNCIFSKNKIMHSEPFLEQDLPDEKR